jgi:hypothetical protein
VITYVTFDQVADAIFRQEHSRVHPYGIMERYLVTTPRQACLNTIAHQYALWRQAGCRGDFIDWLGNAYCPPSVDPVGNYYWRRNVRWILIHQTKPRKDK